MAAIYDKSLSYTFCVSALNTTPMNSASRLPMTARARVDSFSEANPSGIEASLIQLLNEHNQASLRLRDLAEKAKKEAMMKASRVSDQLVEAVNNGVQESFVNEKRIEVEIRFLAATIGRFVKQTDQWLAATHAFNTAVKEIGDFENWMKTMEFDCKSIVSAIHNIPRE